MSTRRTRRVLAGGGTMAVLCLAVLLGATTAWAAAGWTPQSSGTTNGLGGVACAGPARRLGRGRRRNDPRHKRRRRHLDRAERARAHHAGPAGVAFVDAGHGWAVGAAGTILVTSDGGATWTKQTAPAGTPDLAGVAFSDRKPRLGRGRRRHDPRHKRRRRHLDRAERARAHHAGPDRRGLRRRRPRLGRGRRRHDPRHKRRRRHLDQQTAPAGTPDLGGVAFADQSHGWAVGAAGTILVTSDGGATWTAPSAPVPTTQDLAGVAFVDAGHGWAVGAAGTILHTSERRCQLERAGLGFDHRSHVPRRSPTQGAAGSWGRAALSSRLSARGSPT